MKASLAGWKPDDMADEIKPKQIKISAGSAAESRPERELVGAGSGR